MAYPSKMVNCRILPRFTVLLFIYLSNLNCAYSQVNLVVAPRRFKSLRKHAYSNILQNFQPKKENFQMKNLHIFHISAQNINGGYSLELHLRGGSNEYPQSMFFF